MSYAKAIRYATKLTPFPRDLVHDAYLRWSTIRTTDLFSQELGTVFAVIKNIHFNNLNKNYIRKGSRQEWKNGEGIKIHKSFVYLDDENTNFSLSTLPNQENDLISEGYTQQLSQFDNKVLNLKVSGYNGIEIQDKLNVSNPTVTKAIKRIKAMLQNPFNGNKTKVIKRISRGTFDKAGKYAEEYEMGDNADYNEYYTLMTSKLNPDEGLLIKEVKD